jgi:tRNA threonylcarbamoyl adenosine modification protein YjeE
VAEIEIALTDPAATERLGADIAMALKPGDCILLCGELGAGKTTLARGLIRQLAGDPQLEVPSPTFTLCNVYDTGLPVSHFDLYRLADASEAGELAIGEAGETGAVLVEWPERAPSAMPAGSATVTLADAPDDGRVARLTLPAGDEARDGAGLGPRIARSLAARRFLADAGHGEDRRRHLQGDASSRRYETVQDGGPQHGERRLVLMDAPRRPDGPPVRDGKPYSRIAHLAEDVAPFAAIAAALGEQGFAAPRVHAADFARGFLLLDHLGEATILAADGRPDPRRYGEAARLLARLHEKRWPATFAVADRYGQRRTHAIPSYDRDAMQIEASLLPDWYVPHVAGKALDEPARAQYAAIWDELIDMLSGSPATLVLRDYHSPNLVWRDSAPFPANVGLLDFQDAVLGPEAYDVASLCQDARADVSADLERQLVDTYVAARAGSPNVGASAFDTRRFARDYAIVAAQRASKILGIFVRLKVRDGKGGYLRHLPRMRDYLARSLAHPALASYRDWWQRHAASR